MHDRIAELRGLRAELANCENGPRRDARSEAAADVRAEISRVRGELEDQAAELERHAEQLLADGRDGLAGESREQARAIREALEADQPKRAGKRTAAAAKPPETR